jgi:hypothetical protein
MLRSYVLNYSDTWDEWLPLAEFSYNNSYQESIKMALFKALYVHRCRTVELVKTKRKMVLWS